MVIMAVSISLFRLFRWFRFGVSMVSTVPVVSVVSFRWFRFGVSGFSICQEKMRGQRGRLRALAGICNVHESYF